MKRYFKDLVIEFAIAAALLAILLWMACGCQAVKYVYGVGQLKDFNTGERKDAP